MTSRTTAYIITALLLGLIVGYLASSAVRAPPVTATYTTTLIETSTTATTVASTTTAVATTTVTATITVTKPYTPYPLTINDAYNRSVTFKAPPRSVVSLAPSITQMLVSLGLCDKIAGLDQFSYELLRELGKASCLRPNAVVININVMNPTGYNGDAILLLRPDLVLADAGFEALWTQKLPALQSYGINVFFLKGTKASSIPQIERDVLMVGEVFGVPEEALAVVKWMNATLSSLPPVKPKSVAQIAWINPDGGFYAAGGNTFIGYEIALAGGINALANYSGWGPFEPAVLLATNPQVIVLSPMGLGNNCTAVEQMLKRVPGISGVDAYRSGNVYVVTELAEDSISQPSVMTVYGVQILHLIIAGEAPHCITTQWALRALNMTLP